MELKLSDALPALNTIYEQQLLISDKLQKLIETFKREPEPVEPTLRLMLKPLNEEMDEMQQALTESP